MLYLLFFIEQDGHGWSGAYSTVTASIHPDTLGEYTGGALIVWSPDDEQGFPSGFGEDGRLFTEDDPVVLLPAGYTIVIMDTEVFTFDRSQNVVLDLIEPEDYVPDDFSEMGYAEAFNALVDKAMLDVSTGNLGRAKKSLLAAQSLDPNNPGVLRLLGEVYRDLGDLESSIKAFDEALHQRPHDLVARFSKASTLLIHGHHAEAEAELKTCIDMDPENSEFHNSLGVALQWQKREDEALQQYALAVLFDETNEKALQNLGGLALTTKRFDQAIEAYESLLHINPGSTGIWNGLGIAYQKAVDARLIQDFSGGKIVSGQDYDFPALFFKLPESLDVNSLRAAR